MQDRASKNEESRNKSAEDGKPANRAESGFFFWFVAIQDLFGYNIRIDEVEL